MEERASESHWSFATFAKRHKMLERKSEKTFFVKHFQCGFRVCITRAELCVPTIETMREQQRKHNITTENEQTKVKVRKKHTETEDFQRSIRSQNRKRFFLESSPK